LVLYIFAVKVEWDEAKNLANQRKHGVSFEEAEQLFAEDGDYLEIFDEGHSESEDRFLAIGPLARGIAVVWTERDEETIRIISARWASEREQALFQAYRNDRL
jgi:uncharacterized DUF497 family protein